VNFLHVSVPYATKLGFFNFVSCKFWTSDYALHKHIASNPDKSLTWEDFTLHGNIPYFSHELCTTGIN